MLRWKLEFDTSCHGYGIEHGAATSAEHGVELLQICIIPSNFVFKYVYGSGFDGCIFFIKNTLRLVGI